MRPLVLHSSALNDAEYELFTTGLRDLADDTADTGTAHDDAYYDQITVGVREARAWLRGRYSHVPSASIDSVLKLFSPTLGQTDTLSGGQFFAVLRLVVHVEDGKDVDRGLAFVQAHPKSLQHKSRPPSPPKSIKREIPPAPSRHPASASNPEKPRPITSNPFSADPSPSSLHLQQRSDSGASSSQPQPLFPSPSSHNPFLTRSKTAPSRSMSLTQPPLPPRPIQPQPPPRPTALAPAPPPKHVTSTLMKQSLQASKTAQSLKRAEEQLEKERVMQVLRSSSANGSSSALRDRSSSPSKWDSSSSYDGSNRSSPKGERPPLPKRRSPPMSTSSLEQVALAGNGPFGIVRRLTFASPDARSSGSGSTRRTNVSLSPTRSAPAPLQAPPTHPDIAAVSPRRTSFKGHHIRSLSYSAQQPGYGAQRDREKESEFEMIYGEDGEPSTSTNSNFSPRASPFAHRLDMHPSSASSPFVAPTPDTATPFTTPRESPFTPIPNSPLHSPVSFVTASQSSPSPFSPTTPSPTSNSRMARSNSLHHPTPPRPPVPPPLGTRRQRPESVQVLGDSARERALSTSTSKSDGTSASNPAANPNNSGLGGMSALHRTLAKLDPTRLEQVTINLRNEMQPRLDKARFKAEAGLSRRGFVPSQGERNGRQGGDREGLISASTAYDEFGYDEMGSDESEDGGEERRGREGRRGGGEREGERWVSVGRMGSREEVEVGPGEGWGRL